MWSYECVFEHSKTGEVEKKDGESGIQMAQTSVSIVAADGIQALQYAAGRLRLFPEHELVGVIRHHAIVEIL